MRMNFFINLYTTGQMEEPEGLGAQDALLVFSGMPGFSRFTAAGAQNTFTFLLESKF